jgi:hypothetical protein
MITSDRAVLGTRHGRQVLARESTEPDEHVHGSPRKQA